MDSNATNNSESDGEYRTFDEYRERFYKHLVKDKSVDEDKDGAASFGRDLAKELVNRK